MDAPHIRTYLLGEEQRTSAVSAAHHFRNVCVFFGWLASEGERENPNSMDPFADRRVTAIMRIFMDTGYGCPAWRICASTPTTKTGTMSS